MGGTPPRGNRLALAFAEHLRGYLVSTQSTFMVVCHFGWMMMLLIGLNDSGLPGSGLRQLGQWLLRAYAGLGGVDDSGHGGVPELMEVWGKLSVGVYALQWLLRRVRGERPLWSFWRAVGLSTGIAAAGYGVAFAAIGPAMSGSGGEALGILFAFVGVTFFSTAWALAFQRTRLLTPPPPEAGTGRAEWTVPGAPPPPRAARPRPVGLPMRASLGAGLLVLVLGIAVGTSRPRGNVRVLSEEEARAWREQEPPITPPDGAAPGTPSRPWEAEPCRGVGACQLACDDHDAAACAVLSELVQYGVASARRDSARARTLLQRACALGHGPACVRLTATGEPDAGPLRVATPEESPSPHHLQGPQSRRQLR